MKIETKQGLCPKKGPDPLEGVVSPLKSDARRGSDPFFVQSPKQAINPRVHQIYVISMVLLVVLIQSGCASGRMIFPSRHQDPMAGAPRPRYPKNPHLEEVVAHLNQNTDRNHGWRADNIKIQTGGFSLSGKLAVEKDRRVRLVVSSPMGTEVDLGSNDERIWVLSRRMDPAFVTCRHENMDVARQKIGIPFEPEWLMQVLGVSRLTTTGVKMEAAPNLEQARLVQEVVSAHGYPLRRVVLVDIRKGIVLEHSLYDYNSVPVAIAKLKDYRPVAGFSFPHRVVLEMPQNQISMTMDLGRVQINPKSIPSQIWEMPDTTRYEVVHLDKGVDRTRVATRPESAVRLDGIEDDDSDDRDSSDHDERDADPDSDTAGRARLSNEKSDSVSSKPADEDWAR